MYFAMFDRFYAFIFVWQQARQKAYQPESSSSPPRVIKPRTRGKRPFSITPTTTVNPTAESNTDQTFQQINSFNKDFYKESAHKKASNDSTRNSPEKVMKSEFLIYLVYFSSPA